MKKIVIICLIMTLTLTGCKSLGQVLEESARSVMTFFTGTKTITAYHTLPAEYDFSNYEALVVKRITVSGSNNIKRHILKNRFKKSLLKNLHDSGYFMVYSGEKSVGKPNFELAADITNADFFEHRRAGEGKCNGKKCYLYTTSAKWKIKVLVSAYDAETGKFLWKKKFSEKKSEHKMQQSGYVSFNSRLGFDEVMNNLAYKIRFSLQPKRIPVKAEVYVNEKIPGMANGVKYAEARNWNKAVDSFKVSMNEVTRNKYSSDVASQVYYNYGVVLAYGINDYDAAIEMIEKAILLQKEDDYIEEITNIKKLKNDAKKLAKQNYKS